MLVDAPCASPAPLLPPTGRILHALARHPPDGVWSDDGRRALCAALTRELLTSACAPAATCALQAAARAPWAPPTAATAAGLVRSVWGAHAAVWEGPEARAALYKALGTAAAAAPGVVFETFPPAVLMALVDAEIDPKAREQLDAVVREVVVWAVQGLPAPGVAVPGPELIDAPPVVAGGAVLGQWIRLWESLMVARSRELMEDDLEAEGALALTAEFKGKSEGGDGDAPGPSARDGEEGEEGEEGDAAEGAPGDGAGGGDAEEEEGEEAVAPAAVAVPGAGALPDLTRSAPRMTTKRFAMEMLVEVMEVVRRGGDTRHLTAKEYGAPGEEQWLVCALYPQMAWAAPTQGHSS